MRYIADSSGYLKEVAFGCQLTCSGNTCTEYTGSVPSGYTSLEDWYVKESEKLYRWKIVSGNLTLDSSATAPATDGSWQDLSYSTVNFKDGGTCVYRRRGDLVEIRFKLHAKIDLTASTLSNMRLLCTIPDEIVPKSYLVRDTGIYVGTGTKAPGRLVVYVRGTTDAGRIEFWGFPGTIAAGDNVSGHLMYFI